MIMRPLEILVFILLFGALIGFLIDPQRRPRWVGYLPAGAVVFAALSGELEGARIAMIPGYGLTLVVTLLSIGELLRVVRDLPPQGDRKVLRLLGAGSGLLVWGFAILVALQIIPFVINLPE
jgi:hypothetical protein